MHDRNKNRQRQKNLSRLMPKIDLKCLSLSYSNPILKGFQQIW